MVLITYCIYIQNIHSLFLIAKVKNVMDLSYLAILNVLGKRGMVRVFQSDFNHKFHLAIDGGKVTAQVNNGHKPFTFFIL